MPPAKGGRSRKQPVESSPQTAESPENQPLASGLKFSQALSWTVGRPIAEGELNRRLQAFYTEISSKDQDDIDLEPLRPIAKDVANERLLKHKNRGVQSWATCCIVEIIRLFAPNAPYTGKELKVGLLLPQFLQNFLTLVEYLHRYH
jgi:sister chromatid cohesion protein PDS5